MAQWLDEYVPLIHNAAAYLLMMSVLTFLPVSLTIEFKIFLLFSLRSADQHRLCCQFCKSSKNENENEQYNTSVPHSSKQHPRSVNSSLSFCVLRFWAVSPWTLCGLLKSSGGILFVQYKFPQTTPRRLRNGVNFHRDYFSGSLRLLVDNKACELSWVSRQHGFWKDELPLLNVVNINVRGWEHHKQ